MSREFDLKRYLPYLLNRSGTRIADSFSVNLRNSYGITLQMWRVMAAVHHQDGQRVGELSGTTSIEISTLSRLLTTMEARGLVERRRPSRQPGADARAVTINLTKDGHSLTEAIIPLALQYEEIALDGLSQQEVATLKHLLDRLFENMAALDEEDAQKLAS